MTAAWWTHPGNRPRILTAYVRNPSAKNRENLVNMLAHMAGSAAPTMLIAKSKHHPHEWVKYFQEEGGLNSAKAQALLVLLAKVPA